MNEKDLKLMANLLEIKKYCDEHLCKDCMFDGNSICNECFSSCPAKWDLEDGAKWKS